MSHRRDFAPILDHIHVQVRDLEASRPFYRAVVQVDDGEVVDNIDPTPRKS